MWSTSCIRLTCIVTKMHLLLKNIKLFVSDEVMIILVEAAVVSSNFVNDLKYGA